MRFKESSCECLAHYPANNLISAPDCLGSTRAKQILIFYESITKGWDKRVLFFFKCIHMLYHPLEVSVNTQIKEAKCVTFSSWVLLSEMCGTHRGLKEQRTVVLAASLCPGEPDLGARSCAEHGLLGGQTLLQPDLTTTLFCSLFFW